VAVAEGEEVLVVAVAVAEEDAEILVVAVAAVGNNERYC